jgi:two-component system LytT family sensor kinase
MFGIRTTWSIAAPNILIIAALFRGVYVLILSTGYWFALHFYKSLQKNFLLVQAQLIAQKKQLQLEKEIIIAENAYLQAQVSPHLMFNTLNYIYNSIEEISADAAEAVMLLSDISRYSMKRPDEYGLVFLNEELEQVGNFIRLNQLRFNFNLYVDYQVDGNFEGLKIAPLILLGFVENLFKHGDCSDSTYPAQVHVRLSEGRLVFNIRNKKSRRARISHGIGVTNTKMRLDNRYKDNYVLDIDNGDEFYILDLRLKLDYAELLYS